jgi:hypothetical protein
MATPTYPDQEEEEGPPPGNEEFESLHEEQAAEAAEEEDEIGGIIGRVNVATATLPQLTKYLRTKNMEYELGIDVEEELFDIFRDDFHTWTVATFDKLNGAYVRELRNTMEKKGVTMPKTHLIAEKLYTLLQQDEMTPWPEGKDLPMAVLAARRLKSDQMHQNSEWRQAAMQQEIERQIEGLQYRMTPSNTL